MAMSTNVPKSIKLEIKETTGNGRPESTLHEDRDSSGYPQKRGDDLLCTEDEIFLPALGRYVRDLARNYPSTTITVKLT